MARSRNIKLVVDHILTLKAGGLNVVENFQTVCVTCNKKKLREGRTATVAYLARLP
ncbi:HNH endonuclease [Curvibacter microcysteis]|uniref:HNH endonuclease n=1 Tax=Curvibacter microcysteis TaxID=3026419 RepID=UPI003905FE72